MYIQGCIRSQAKGIAFKKNRLVFGITLNDTYGVRLIEETLIADTVADTLCFPSFSGRHTIFFRFIILYIVDL